MSGKAKPRTRSESRNVTETGAEDERICENMKYELSDTYGAAKGGLR